MTPLSGNRAISPRLALAKSALSDHGSEAVEFLLNSRVDVDAGLESPAACACAIAAASAKINPAAVARYENRDTPRSDRRSGSVNVSLLCQAMVPGRSIDYHRREPAS